MKVSDFSYKIPYNQIAFYPVFNRSSCRLMYLDGETGNIKHQLFNDLLKILLPGDLLVFNNTKVIPARCYGYKLSGGKVEILVERIISDNIVLARLFSSKKLTKGSMFFLENSSLKIAVFIKSLCSIFFELFFDSNKTVIDILNIFGHLPLPPYIKRPVQVFDNQFYQTVYGSVPGAIASPTAGLHFDNNLLCALKYKGINMVFVTLHVGSGSFQPVIVDNIDDHVMHSEYVSVGYKVVQAVISCKSRGNKVIAVGTTSVRALETASMYAACTNIIEPYVGDTDIFIVPGYAFRIVDAMITNFHLSKSTLLMLVSAFAGHKNIFKAYREAIISGYRFFSYGDAMFITCNPVYFKN